VKIPDAWTFRDAGVADGFDAHVREQLPWYDMATDAVVHIVRHYLPEHGLVYDIGASTGNIGRAIAPVLEQRSAKLIAVEESREMAAKYDAPGSVECMDAYEVSYQPFDVAVCFLVLMFMPIGRRATLVENLRRSLRKGGAIIVFDKAMPACGYFGTVMRRLTMSWKLNNGATPQDIISKELSLSGVQRPLNPAVLGPDARQFFAFGEFAGYLIENPE
jgi:tRNA (cmo5U34)-methyltransferase